MVEAATDRLIGDRWGNPISCNTSGWVYGHKTLADSYQFRVATCKVRGRCPCCGVDYGIEQGVELRSLMAAALERRCYEPRPDSVLGWGIVVTMPREVSEYIGGYVDRGRPGQVVRGLIGRVVRIAGDTLARMFGVSRGELGVALNVHYWASADPSREAWHWHIHAMVPNVRRDGSILRRQGRFSDQELEGVRTRLGEALRRAWPELALAGVRLEPNVHVKFMLANRGGERQWRHRARYDSRHPWADVVATMRTAEGRARLFGDAAATALVRIANRIERLQGVKLRRYLGWLVPGRRRVVGLVRDELKESEWYRLDDGWRRIKRWTDRGLELVRYDRLMGEVVSEVLAERVAWEAQGPPVRWRCEGQG